MMKAKPKKSLGQNFLVDAHYQRKIVDVVAAVRPKAILEIGPGHGAITEYLQEWDVPLTVIEKDEALAAGLAKKFPHVKVVAADALCVDVAALLSPKVTVVGNLPYNVATQIFFHLLKFGELFDHFFFMLQKEVGERCLAAPGLPDYGFLSVSVQFFTKVERLFTVPPTVFKPRPKVLSSFMKFSLKGKKFEENLEFILFVKRLFTLRRKKIASALKKMYRRQNFSLSPCGRGWPEGPGEGALLNARVEDLSVEQLMSLYHSLS